MIKIQYIKIHLFLTIIFYTFAKRWKFNCTYKVRPLHGAQSTACIVQFGCLSQHMVHPSSRSSPVSPDSCCSTPTQSRSMWHSHWAHFCLAANMQIIIIILILFYFNLSHTFYWFFSALVLVTFRVPTLLQTCKIFLREQVFSFSNSIFIYLQSIGLQCLIRLSLSMEMVLFVALTYLQTRLSKSCLDHPANHPDTFAHN